MPKKHQPNKHHKGGARQENRPSLPQSRQEARLNPGVEFTVTANALRRELQRYSQDPLLHLASPWTLAACAIGYFAGPEGTGEVSNVNARQTRDMIAGEASLHYGAQRPDKSLLIKAGILTQQEDTQLGNLVRSGLTRQFQARQAAVEQRFIEALQILADREDSPILKAFAQVPPEEREKVAELAGKLVAYRSLLAREFKTRYPDPVVVAADVNAPMKQRAEATTAMLDFLAETRFLPSKVTDRSIVFSLRKPEAAYGIAGETVSVEVTVPSSDTVLIGGPGLLVAGANRDFERFPHVVYADRSRFISAMLGELARGNGKKLGRDLSQVDVVSMYEGMDVAAEQYGTQANVVLLSMVHSAPSEAVQRTMQQLGEKLPNGARVIIMIPDRVKPGETSVNIFAQEARAAGLTQVEFAVSGQAVREYTFPFPLAIPGELDLNRQATILVFSKGNENLPLRRTAI